VKIGTIIAAVFAALCTTLLTCAASAQAPAELRGKSVTASWTEEREQRSGAQTEFKLVATPQTLIVYVSTEGRLFTRRAAYNIRAGGPQNRSGSRENIGDTGGGQGTQLHGHSLTVTNKMGGGARMARIDFNPDFSNCTASVIVGRSSPGTIAKGKNWSTGEPMEIKSAKVTNPSCSVQSGNALGN
jgi:hypothetical protein